MATVFKIIFYSIIIAFMGFILNPIVVFFVVMKNTTIWGLTNTGMIGFLGAQAVILFISAIIFLGIFNLVKGST